MKKDFSDFLLFKIAIPLAAFVYKIIAFTYRFKELNGAGLSPYQKNKGNYLFAFWHSRMLASLHFYRNFNAVVLASMHKDGEIAAEMVKRFGFFAVRGSTTRGGAKALMYLKKLADEGRDIAITVDGPRGPRNTVGNGILYLAKLTGKEIVPFAFDAKWKMQLGSWDRFLIPLPFTKGVVVFGKPLKVPAGTADIEIYRKRLQEEMLRIDKECEEALR